MSFHIIKTTVKGISADREVESRLTLADFLRHDLRLTGTHCIQGVGAALRNLRAARDSRQAAHGLLHLGILRGA